MHYIALAPTLHRVMQYDTLLMLKIPQQSKHVYTMHKLYYVLYIYIVLHTIYIL
jgi:hypothetical protein